MLFVMDLGVGGVSQDSNSLTIIILHLCSSLVFFKGDLPRCNHLALEMWRGTEGGDNAEMCAS